MAIVNFGSLSINYIYQVPHFSIGNESVRSRHARTEIGGSGLKQSLALARAGLPVHHVGLVGKNGQHLRTFLAENGVDTRLIGDCDAPQGHAILQVNPAKERAAILFGGSNSQITPDVVDRCLEPFGSGDFLLVQNEITSIPYLIDAAYDKGMRIIFNASPIDQDVFLTDCNKVEWLICNDTECMEMADCDDITAAFSKIQEKYPQCGIIVTMGSEGSLCYRDGKVIFQHAYPAKVVDLFNAGDAFIGYFVAGLAADYALADCLDLASRAAAVTISRPGGTENFPTLEEVQNWAPDETISE